MKPIGCRLMLLMLTGWLLVGCNTLSERKQTTTLEDTLSTYAATIRWSALEKAYSYRLPDPEDPDEIPGNLGNIRVTSYEVVQGPTMTDEQTAIQSVSIDYIHRDVQVMRRLLDRQVWHYDAEKERWYLKSKVPEFK